MPLGTLRYSLPIFFFMLVYLLVLFLTGRLADLTRSRARWLAGLSVCSFVRAEGLGGDGADRELDASTRHGVGRSAAGCRKGGLEVGQADPMDGFGRGVGQGALRLCKARETCVESRGGVAKHHIDMQASSLALTRALCVCVCVWVLRRDAKAGGWVGKEGVRDSLASASPKIHVTFRIQPLFFVQSSD